MYKKEKKDKLFADHLTQVCKAHYRGMVSFFEQAQVTARR